VADDSGRPDVVVAGVDGSAESTAALSWASRYAKATGATVRAVLAWHYPAAVGVAPVGVAPAAVREETERAKNAQLVDAIGKAIPDSAAAAAVEAKLSYGHPAEVLIDESKHADLLVVGSHGHGGFTGMLTGSVSVHVVNHAECPVVVVRNR
jgi:nucleotide-binding universal stress UspA family protein